MAQHDFDVANGSGATVRADLNAALEAIATSSSGATAPTVTFSNQWWHDTAAQQLKRRNPANTAWIVIADISGSTFTMAASAMGNSNGSFTPSLSFVTPGDLNVVYGTRNGIWFKNGRVVTAVCSITTSTFTHSTAAGNFLITTTGLPTSSSTYTLNVYVTGAETSNVVFTGTVTARLAPNSSTFNLVQSSSGTGFVVLGTTGLPSGVNLVIRFTMTYFTDS